MASRYPEPLSDLRRNGGRQQHHGTFAPDRPTRCHRQEGGGAPYQRRSEMQNAVSQHNGLKDVPAACRPGQARAERQDKAGQKRSDGRNRKMHPKGR